MGSSQPGSASALTPSDSVLPWGKAGAAPCHSHSLLLPFELQGQRITLNTIRQYQVCPGWYGCVCVPVQLL